MGGEFVDVPAWRCMAVLPPLRLGVIALKRALDHGPLAALIKQLGLAEGVAASLGIQLEAVPPSPILVVTIALDEWISQDADNWPVVDCAFCWGAEFISGAVAKVRTVIQHQGAVELNSLDGLQRLEDRAEIYQHCAASAVPVPEFVVWRPGDKIQDLGHAVEVENRVLSRPFLEKPLEVVSDSVYVYYQEESGGGRQLLAPFGRGAQGHGELELDKPLRALGPTGTVADCRGFLYDKFIPTGGVQLRVYLVGKWLCEGEAVHALSPEDRICTAVHAPAMLRLEEKRLCTRAAEAFGQPICALDLLRTPERSFVVAIHAGLIPNSHQVGTNFFSLAAQLIRRLVISTLRPQLLRLQEPLSMQHSTGFMGHLASRSVASAMYPEQGSVSRAWGEATLRSPCSARLVTAMFPRRSKLNQRLSSKEDMWQIPAKLVTAGDGNPMVTVTVPDEVQPTSEGPQLCGVIFVARHADRTPKEKAKCKTAHPSVLGMFAPHQSKEIRLKSVRELEHFRELLPDLIASTTEHDEAECWKQMLGVLQAERLHGVYRKVQLKPDKHDPQSGVVTKATVVMKWGGEITALGLKQAGQLGDQIREQVYGANFARLHTSMRHDLKIYSSDEGRVQFTAAAFATHFLKFDHSLPLALVRETMVGIRHDLLDRVPKEAEGLTKENGKAVTRLLEPVDEVRFDSQLAQRLDLRADRHATEQRLAEMAAVCGGPLTATAGAYFTEVRARLRNWLCVLAEATSEVGAAASLKVNDSMPMEEARAVYQRWRSIAPMCDNAEGAELLDKMPALLDHLLYEESHNASWLRTLQGPSGLSAIETLCQLREAVQPGAELLLELKLGSDERTRAITGAKVGRSLLDKIRFDLRVAGGLETGANAPRYIDWYSAPSSPEESEHVRSRLHFTHRSHLSAVLAVLEYLCPEGLREIYAGFSSEVQFCSHLVLQVFKDGPNTEPYVTVGYSPGIAVVPSSCDDCSRTREAQPLWRKLPLSSFDRLLTSALAFSDFEASEPVLVDSDRSTVEAAIDGDSAGENGVTGNSADVEKLVGNRPDIDAMTEKLLHSDGIESRACVLI